MLRLRPTDIEIGERHRALSDDAVSRLAKSMGDIGLRHPISVRVVDEMEVDGELTSGVPVLVAGAHRLAAAKQLGWAEIDCVEVNDDAIDAEMWEVAENLHRLDLTREQRDEHIRRYAELLGARVEAERLQVRQNDAPEFAKPPKQVKGVARRVAEETGISVRTIQRALNPQPKPVQPARSREEIILAEANAIISAWNRASPEAREMALTEIDGPVMDRAHAA